MKNQITINNSFFKIDLIALTKKFYCYIQNSTRNRRKLKAITSNYGQFNSNGKLSDIIEKYRNKSGDSDPEKRFYFDSKRINPNLTLKENGIMNNSNIFVIKPHVEYAS